MECHYCTAPATGHYCSEHEPSKELEELRTENEKLLSGYRYLRTLIPDEQQEWWILSGRDIMQIALNIHVEIQKYSDE